MALNGPDCSRAVYGQVTMAFPGGNIIEEAPEEIAAALALVAANQPGGVAVAVRIRVTDASGNILNCCPDGFGFDSVAGYCKLLPPSPTPPPPPPPPPPQPPPPDLGGDGDGDDLTIGIGSILLELQQIILLLQKLTGDGSKPIDYTQCCHAIAVGIAALVKIVQQISVKLSAPGIPPAPPIDLTAVVTELECVCAQLTAISTSSATVATDLAPGLKSIADAVANAKPTDVSQIVEQLKALVREGDIPQEFIDSLASQGFLSPEIAQLLSGVDWSKGIVGVFRTAGWEAVKWFMHTAGWEWDGSKFVAVSTGPSVTTLVELMLKHIVGFTGFAFDQGVRDAVASLVKLLTPTRIAGLGEQAINPDDFLVRAVAVIFDTWLTNFLMHLADIIPGESAAHLLESLTGLLGLEEMREVQLGPLIQFGPARVAEMRAKLLYRQEIPGIGTLAAFHSRGLITTAEYQGLEGLAGVPPQLVEATRDAAFSGLNARMLLRLAGTGLFSDADLADELTFGAMRPASQHRLMLAAAYLGTEPERNKLRSALERFYTAGLISDNDLVSRLNSAEHNTDRMNLILSAVQLEKQAALAKEYEAAYSHEFVNGLMDAPSYQSALEGIGMQPADVAARMFRDESHIAVTQTLGAERAARAAVRKTQAEARKAAIEGFRTGSIDATALTAALNLAGLTPAQTAAEVSYQALASLGALRWIYGRHLSPQDATLLRQQVQDLTRQREIELLTDAQYVSQLQALSIAPRVIQALRAGANAHISPKTQAILTPPVAP